MGPHLSVYVTEKGCTMDSVDSIDKLIEIERQAAAIIKEAEDKASRILLDAKNKSESLLKDKLAEARMKFESDLAASRDALRTQTQKEIEDYKASLKNIPLNQTALSAALEGLLKQEV